MSSAYGTIRAMENLSEPLRLGIALLLGAVIGLEREINEKKQIGNNTPTAIVGLRSFALTSGLGALAGIVEVLINTAQLVGKAVSYELAAWTFVLVNAVNLGGKTVYSFVQGEKTFAFRFGLSMGLIVLASVAALHFI